jgi:hypothetical protein
MARFLDLTTGLHWRDARRCPLWRPARRRRLQDRPRSLHHRRPRAGVCRRTSTNADLCSWPIGRVRGRVRPS